MIELKNICKSFDDAMVIKDLSLVIEKENFVSIVGKSGSGKTTLLNMIGTLDFPDSGIISVDNINISKFSQREIAEYRNRKIGFVFQSYYLIPVLTVRENIEMPVLLDDKKPDKEYINDLIEMLGLKEREKHLPNQLSGGQQQRVSIARALANKPSIIFADEPTGNLDRKNGLEVMEILKASAKKYEQTLVLITHEMSIANSADRVIEISDGKIVSDSKNM